MISRIYFPRSPKPAPPMVNISARIGRLENTYSISLLTADKSFPIIILNVPRLVESSKSKVPWSLSAEIAPPARAGIANKASPNSNPKSIE